MVWLSSVDQFTSNKTQLEIRAWVDMWYDLGMDITDTEPVCNYDTHTDTSLGYTRIIAQLKLNFQLSKA